MMETANKENIPEARGAFAIPSKTFTIGTASSKTRKSFGPAVASNFLLASPMVSTQTYKRSPKSMAAIKNRAMVADKLATPAVAPISPSKRKSMLNPAAADMKKRKVSLVAQAPTLQTNQELAALLKPAWRPTSAAQPDTWTLDQVCAYSHNYIYAIL